MGLLERLEDTWAWSLEDRHLHTLEDRHLHTHCLLNLFSFISGILLFSVWRNGPALCLRLHTMGEWSPGGSHIQCED